MPHFSALCLATSQSQADAIVTRLRTAGFANSAISVIVPDRDLHDHGLPRSSTKSTDGAATGAGAGGVVGSALGLLVGIGAISVPGFGPLIAAGPILAAMSGAAVGAALGGIAGALIGLGVPEYQAMRYEGKIRNGNILISVHAKDAAQIKGVQEIFWASGAQDITSAPVNGPSFDHRTARGPRGPIAQARTFA